MAGDPETTEFCVDHGWSGSRGVDGREVSCSARTCGTMIGLPHAISALFTYRTVGLGFNLFNHPTKARRRTLPIAKGERFKNCETEFICACRFHSCTEYSTVAAWLYRCAGYRINGRCQQSRPTCRRPGGIRKFGQAG